MNRRLFLTLPPAAFFAEAGAEGSFPEVTAIAEPHFPNRLYQYVWRNWDLANLDRMAAVVGARPAQLAELARHLGLPPKRQFSDDYLRRIYITVIRQNWHLLPEPQIIALLGWSTDQFAFTLKEDDFLDVKLGRVKPACAPLRYHPPTEADRRRAEEIRAVLKRDIPRAIASRPRFAFVEELSKVEPGPGWRIHAPNAPPALNAAAERFGQGHTGATSVDIAIEPSEGRGNFRIQPAQGRYRITAGDEASAIHALYRLRSAAPFKEVTARETWRTRFLYSYFALYGDPLMEGDAAGLPDGYLDRAASNGMTGVWIQGVLNTLAPSALFPEFGEGWQTRLRNLAALVRRAAQFGIRVYLYLNEPRAMPAVFFDKYPEIRGTRFQDIYAMCTSTERVRNWLRESIAHVFREVPDLGGVFTITMSENHTNCFSHGGAWGDRDPVAKDCPRCSKRSGDDAIAEFVRTLSDGIRQHSATAEILSYDWGWGTPLATRLIPKLPGDTGVISISEWSQPVSRGGVNTSVGEYSMSVVGPGSRAALSWKLAKERGLASIAKTQFNNTWEISAVPYIPVLPLVLEHCENLAKAGIQGVMASWTCGGYPSPNLRAASAYALEPRPTKEEILQTEATRIYGAGNAQPAVRAWNIFSNAFQNFPYGVSIYVLPVQHGPANPLRLRPTGLKPGMILFPYDAYSSWRGAYPPATVHQLMAKLAGEWQQGVRILQTMAAAGKEARLELAIARTCHSHFESVANQIEFYLLRDEASGSPQRRQANTQRMIAIAERERQLAIQQYSVASAEPLIGYEASNHYYYTPLDLLEKVLNCDHVIHELRAGAQSAAPL
ncbi:MAG: hypothetical protein JNL98_05945 [Bryobacterales bacterium]|nr:hypothetical protein [Bryobacterales bacterium]